MYGTAWKEDDTARCVLAALSVGFRAIDTASQRKHYNEAGVGVGLKRARDPESLAVVFEEDKRFFIHGGIDVASILRSASANIKQQDYAYGASTITQQVARLCFLDNKKTLWRKFKES